MTRHQVLLYTVWIQKNDACEKNSCNDSNTICQWQIVLLSLQELEKPVEDNTVSYSNDRVCEF